MSAYHISRLIGEARAAIATADAPKALILLADAVEQMHLDNLNMLPATLPGADDTVLEEPEQ